VLIAQAAGEYGGAGLAGALEGWLSRAGETIASFSTRDLVVIAVVVVAAFVFLGRRR